MSSGRVAEYVHVVIGVMIILFNASELGIIIKRRKSIKPYEQLLSSLAVADLLTGIILITHQVYQLSSHEKHTGGTVESNVTFCLVLTTIMISIVSLLSISIDRLVAVKYPMLHRSYVTKRRTWIAAIAEWVLAWILVPVPILAAQYGLVDAKSMALVYSKVVAWILLLSGVTCGLSYIEISRSIYNRPSVNDQIGNENATRVKQKRRTEKTVFLTCLLVVAAYLAFTMPYTVRILKGKQPLEEFAGTMLFCNSVVNPLIYFFKGFLKSKNRRMKIREQQADNKGHGGTKSGQAGK